MKRHPMRFERLSAAFQDQIDTGRIPGAVLWITQGTNESWCKALGKLDPARSDAMTEDALFRIYSMTKPITSVAVLMLVEAGRVKLDASVETYLPELRDLRVGVEDRTGPVPRLVCVPSEKSMTVRDLLRHTSGLTYGSFETSLVKDEYLKAGIESRRFSNQELVQRLAQLPLAYQPGTTWEYSRATDVLGALIERVSGLSLGEFFSERIFSPLGMSDTGFAVAPEQVARIAEPFSLDPDDASPVRLMDVRLAPRFESGGGGLVSTVADYARFQSLMMARGRGPSESLLREETVDEMTRDQLGMMERGPHYLPGADYGFGLGVGVRLHASNTGGIGEYYWGGYGGTFQWIDPRRNVAAILMLQAPNQRNTLRALFYRLVYEEINRL
ncbi:MAG: serine hydrolase domain-containing protein [Burkholderiaceae bacterium]